jgi:saccharopine dehydrogenase (NAD+, L-lysine-forming)
MKRVLVLGGYGVTGAMIARLLLRESDVAVVLAGRTSERARETAARLNDEFSCSRVSAARADAADKGSLDRAFAGADMVVVASSTSRYAGTVARAALDAGVDYYDIQYSAEKTAALRSLEHAILQAGRVFITDGGFHPGLPAAMVRHLAPRFDTLESANCGSVIALDWKSFATADATVRELIEEFRHYDSRYYSRGVWKKMGYAGGAGMKKMDFGAVMGLRACAPMYLSEMAALPSLYPGLDETGFFVGGFNAVTDYLIMPLVIAMMALAPGITVGPAAALMSWGLKRFSRPPYGTMLKLEARGRKDGAPLALDLVVSHDDGYMLTAIPVMACLAQYLDGSISAPGLYCQALCVDPGRFFADMERLGAQVTHCGS